VTLDFDKPGLRCKIVIPAAHLLIPENTSALRR
jgi:hypothetical protein